MKTLNTKKNANPARSVNPRMPHTTPLTIDRNWKTVSFTLALFASFSGSRKVSCFLPVGLGWVVFYFGFCGIEMIELMDDVSSSA